MILTEEVKIKVMGTMIKEYNDLGYTCKAKDIINVKINDLKPYSNVKVLVRCDICGKEYEISYSWYTTQIKNSDKLYCKDCKGIKEQEIFLKKYGVTSPAKLDLIQEKTKKTNLEKYNCEYTLQNKEIREKGCATMMERYGVENAFQSNILREKHYESLHQFSNGSNFISCSKNQKYLNDLYSGTLNFPCGKYNIDIYFNDLMIGCEYSGTGHDLSVRMGKISQEDFNIKEENRLDFIISKNIKIFEIINNKRKLPNDNFLIDIKNKAIEKLQNGYNYVCIDIDGTIIKYK